ncbi:MAG: hypothetical protein JOZ47_06750 [Kutzneria sp.]|nr:hypothetical protein [Kutzneria sp.]
MRRLFWLGLGVAAGVAVSRKIAGFAHRATPAGVAENLADAVREMAGALGTFGADVRAGMAEREEELASEVERKTGYSYSRRRGYAAAPSDAARARGADGR